MVTQTAVGLFDTRLPPDTDSALAFHSGFTYPFTPAYGLSTFWPGVVGVGLGLVGVGLGLVGVGVGLVGVGLVVPPLQTVPFNVNWVGFGLLPLQAPLNPMLVLAPVPSAPL
ncbi:hypothetical protein GCM10027452_36340 [Micromonospora halotolerans]